jgi:hypothetical protein
MRALNTSLSPVAAFSWLCIVCFVFTMHNKQKLRCRNLFAGCVRLLRLADLHLA